MTGDGEEGVSPMDEGMEDILWERIRRVAAADCNENLEIYGALDCE